MKRKTTNEFIKDAKKIHGDKYDYTLVYYINCKTKIKIICPIHGVFEQIPINHLRGAICKKCSTEITSKKRLLSDNEFIKKSKKIHNDKYDYSLINYKGYHKKVKIICTIHGEFEQTPSHHLRGGGCPKCKFDKLSSLYSRDQNEFINLSKKIHNNKYDYSLVNYKNDITKIKIICPIHGEFKQTPNKHLMGRGCQKCGGTSLKTTEEFIKDCKKIHNNKYDYSLVNYINGSTRVKIICSKHGIFNKKPTKHLGGQGCPKCKESNGESKIRRLLEEKGINYNFQKAFEDCVYDKPLKFDFYIPKKNIAIEFDGIQHFEPIEFFGGKKRFKVQQEVDKIKTNYCKDNNIKLIRISYLDNVNDKLNKYL